MKLIISSQNETTLFTPFDTDALSDENANAVCKELLDFLKLSVTCPTEEWNLSTRARNVLIRHNLLSFASLRACPPKDIARLRMCGHLTINEVAQEAMRQGTRLHNWEVALVMLHQMQFTHKKELDVS